MDGQSMVIATKDPKDFPQGSKGFIATDLSDGSDWYYTLKDSTAAMTCSVQRSGEHYTMHVKYYIDDYYDFDKDSNITLPYVNITAGDLYHLQIVGLANFFRVTGL